MAVPRGSLPQRRRRRKSTAIVSSQSLSSTSSLHKSNGSCKRSQTMLYRPSRLADYTSTFHTVSAPAFRIQSCNQIHHHSLRERQPHTHTLGHQNVPLCIRLFNVSVAVNHVPVIGPPSIHWLQFMSQMRASHPLANCQIITTISSQWVVNLHEPALVCRTTPSPKPAAAHLITPTACLSFITTNWCTTPDRFAIATVWASINRGNWQMTVMYCTVRQFPMSVGNVHETVNRRNFDQQPLLCPATTELSVQHCLNMHLVKRWQMKLYAV